MLTSNSKARSEPFVSVVTPFYNTGQYLEECIRSVLSQTYHNYEYLLVNNCSTDRSLDIANTYAKKDSRIKVYTNIQFMTQMGNYNNALRLISKESKYCKIVEADNFVFSNCIQEMVDVAEKHPSVGVVGALRIKGSTIGCKGLPYPSQKVKGTDVLRIYLMQRKNLLGNPTCNMISSQLIRERHDFYDENSMLEDLEVFFQILGNVDFGYVHQVLSFTRNQDSITSSIEIYNPYLLHAYILMAKYGKIYLTDNEYKKYFTEIQNEYFQYLARCFIRSHIQRGENEYWKEFWNYHKKGCDYIQCNYKSLLNEYIFDYITDYLLNPKFAVRNLYHFVKNNRLKEKT